MMTSFRLFFLLPLLALAACIIIPPQEPPGPSYYVMRHLNTPINAGDNPPLTEDGQRNAEKLVSFFDLDRPSAIYVTQTVRAQQTAAPLARALGITPKIYEAKNYPALIEAVQAENGSVLIVGHSNTVPDIVEALGGTRPAPISHDRFGDIWHISGIKRTSMKFDLGGE